MTFLKTKVNIIVRRWTPISGCERRKRAFSRDRVHEPPGRAPRARALTICVAISAETTTFREPFGRNPDAKGGPGRSAAWLAHLTGGQGVGGSNPPAPTTFFVQRPGGPDDGGRPVCRLSRSAIERQREMAKLEPLPARYRAQNLREHESGNAGGPSDLLLAWTCAVEPSKK
jgi:hypothetical protein